MSKKPAVTLDVLREAGATVISLAKNPFDLRPATKLITATLMDRSVALGKPVVALYGEHHRVPEHVMLPAITVSDLAKKCPSDIMVGLEFPYNYTRQLEADYLDEFKKPYDADNLGSDLRGIQLMRELSIEHEDAPISNDVFMGTCLKYLLRVHFLDAASTPCQQFLDLDDPLNADLIANAKSFLKNGSLYMSDPNAVVLRNICIATHTVNRIDEMKARYNVLRCGGTHVFGEVGDMDYKDSLAVLFAKLQVPALYVLPVAKGIREIHLPVGVLNHARDTVIVTGLLERRFTTHDRNKELPYIERLLVESGRIPAPA